MVGERLVGRRALIRSAGARLLLAAAAGGFQEDGAGWIGLVVGGPAVDRS
jgi:hypothetical protein